MQERENKCEKKFQHVADIVGSWGPMQWQIFIIATIIYMTAAYTNISLVLYTQPMDFWCKDPLVEMNNETKNVCEVKGVKCNEFTFDKSFYRRLLTSEFQLVCDRSWFASMAQSLHQLGYGISGVLFGFMSDNYGRKFSLQLALLTEIVAGFFQAFTTSTTI